MPRNLFGLIDECRPVVFLIICQIFEFCIVKLFFFCRSIFSSFRFSLHLISFETVGHFFNILYNFDLVQNDLAKPGVIHSFFLETL